jgi:hypothetical protein
MKDDMRIGIMESNQIRYKLSADESQGGYRNMHDIS